MYNNVSNLSPAVSVKPQPNYRNIATQHIATLLGETWFMCWATLLRQVADCWVLSAQICPFSNLSKQHPKCRYTVAKRTQHVAPSNVAICWVDLLRSFGRGFSMGH